MKCKLCDKNISEKYFVVEEKEVCKHCIALAKNIGMSFPLNVWERVKAMEELSESECVRPIPRDKYRQKIYAILRILNEEDKKPEPEKECEKK